MKQLSFLFIFIFFPSFIFCMNIAPHNPLITQAMLIEYMWHAGLVSHDSLCALALVSKTFNKAVHKTAPQRKRCLTDQKKECFKHSISKHLIYSSVLWHKHCSAYAYWVNDNTTKKITFYLVLMDDKEKIITYEKQDDAILFHPIKLMQPYLYNSFDNKGNAGFVMSVFRNTGLIYNLFRYKPQIMEYTLNTKELEKRQCSIDWQRDNGQENVADTSLLQLSVKKIIPKIRTDFFIKYKYVHDHLYIGGSFSKNITLLDMVSGTENGRLAGHTKFIHACIDAQKGNILISGSRDQTVKIWDTRTNTLKASLSATHPDRAQYSLTYEALCLAQEGDHFCTSALSGNIYMRDIETGSFIWNNGKEKTNTHTDGFPFDASTIMMRNNLLFAGSRDGILTIIDLRFGGIISQEKTHNRKIPCLLACNKNDMLFYSGSHDGTINKYDMRNGKLYTRARQKHGVSSLSESADGKTLFSGGADGIRAWDTQHHTALPLNIVKNFDTKISYVDCIATNNNATEIYLSSPTGITTLALKK